MDKPKMDGWSPEQVKAYESAAAALAAEQGMLVDAQAARERAAASPEAMAEQLREQTAAARAARERAARDAEDDDAYRKACKTHGEKRVMRVRTVEGSVVLRAMGATAWEEYSDRIAGFENQSDVLKLSRSVTLDTIVYPPRERVLAMVELLPRLWTHLYAARDELVTGVEEVIRGKG